MKPSSIMSVVAGEGHKGLQMLLKVAIVEGE